MNMKVKRALLILSVVLLSCALFAGCNNHEDESDPPMGSPEVADPVDPVKPQPSDGENPDPGELETPEITDPDKTGALLPDGEQESTEPIDITPIDSDKPEPTPGDIPSGESLKADSAKADSLFSDINSARKDAAQSSLSYDSSLEKAAAAYAEALWQGGEKFRSETDYKTLPNGESVSSLLTQAGYQGSYGNFGYSVWKNDFAAGDEAMLDLIDAVKNSNSYKNKLIAGDYSQVGLICASSNDSSNPFTTVIIMYL